MFWNIFDRFRDEDGVYETHSSGGRTYYSDGRSSYDDCLGNRHFSDGEVAYSNLVGGRDHYKDSEYQRSSYVGISGETKYYK